MTVSARAESSPNDAAELQGTEEGVREGQKPSLWRRFWSTAVAESCGPGPPCIVEVHPRAVDFRIIVGNRKGPVSALNRAKKTRCRPSPGSEAPEVGTEMGSSFLSAWWGLGPSGARRYVRACTGTRKADLWSQ